MGPIGRAATAGFVCLAIILRAQTGGLTSSPKTFRASVNLLELDVSVLDKQRQPVHGLEAGDFTVLVDGQPRQVVAFKAVDVPPAPPPSPGAAAWTRDVAPDVVTNTHPDGRVLAIVIDDGSFGQSEPTPGGLSVDGKVAFETITLAAVQKTRQVAKAALSQLGPNDLAAVVFTENNHTAQNFTTDRVKLTSAIDRSIIFLAPTASARVDPYEDNGIFSQREKSQADQMNDANGIYRGSCGCGLCSIETLDRVAESLRSLPQQRKVILYISNGLAVAPANPGDLALEAFSYAEADAECNVQRHDAMSHVFRQAQLANVTIEAVDPKGLAVGTVGGSVVPGAAPTSDPGALRVEFLRTMAETTGGRAVVNRNDMVEQVPALLSESGSYYLLGVERPPAKDDGALHPVRVRVSRPNVDVRTRSGYFAPTAKERAQSVEPSAPIDRALSRALPTADFPLDVAIAPFAGADRKSELAVVLGVTLPNTQPNVAHDEPVDLLINVFNPESGERVGSSRQALKIPWNASPSPNVHYEWLSRLPLPQGRYEVRLAVQTADGRASSVYAYTEIPDVSKDPLSVSGPVLSMTPAPRAAPAGTFANLIPIVPTAQRTFRATDHLTALVRVAQGRSRTVAPVKVEARVVDDENARVGGLAVSVDVAAFNASRWADVQFDVPVPASAGNYLLDVDVAIGGTSVKRAVRFSVR